MIYNKIPVTFGPFSRVTGPEISYQYDVVQYLVFDDLELPAYYEVDFCNEGDSTSITMVGTADGVRIPDSYMMTGKKVKAYVVVQGEDEGAVETRKEVTLPVRKRSARTDIQPIPAQQLQIDSLIDTMNTVAGAIPPGGTTGQVLAKNSERDYDLDWVDQSGGGGGGGTTNYNALVNKPKIAGVTLTGDKSLSDLGIAAEEDIPTVPVQSVNGKIGAVVLDAEDVGAYEKPSGGIPKSDLSSTVQASLDKADNSLQGGDVATAVDAWLDENIAQETGYVLDRNLVMQNAAAPADLVGAVKEDIKKVYDPSITQHSDTVGYIKNNGDLKTDATGWHCVYTDRISCGPGWKFHYVGGTYSGSVNSVMYFSGTTAVSQVRYALNSDEIVTVPDGVDNVIFQTANSTSGAVSLTVERVFPECINSLDSRVGTLENETEGINAELLDEFSNFNANTLLYATMDSYGGYYASNVSDMCFICTVPAGTRLSRIDVNGVDNSATTGKVPALQILEKVSGTENTYNVVYTQNLNALTAGVTTVNNVDITCEHDSYVAIGNTGYFGRTLTTWDAIPKWTRYSLSSVVNGQVTPNVDNTSRMIYSVKVYGNSGNSYPAVKQIAEDLHKTVQVPEIPPDETLYSRSMSWGNGAYWSPKTIPANRKVLKVRFKVTEACTGGIAFADYSMQSTLSRIFIIKRIPVEAVAGWNEVTVNTTFDRDVNIGFWGLSMMTFKNNDISLADVYKNYLFSSETKGYGQTSTAPSGENIWVAGGAWGGPAYCLAVPFTWFYEEGDLYGTQVQTAKLSEDVKLIPNNADLRTSHVLPKYKILENEQVGFVGKWYEMEVDGQNAHICNAFGGEFYFRVKGTTTVTILWGMDENHTDHSYYAYSIDGGDYTRVSCGQPDITLPDTNYHIVRVVCDSLSDDINSWIWTVGGGFVVHGVDPGEGTAVGLLPDKTPRIVHLGDSITAGTRALGVAGTGEYESDYHSCVQSYSWYCSQALNAISYMDGYGGTGIRNGGTTAKCSTMIDYAAPGIPAAPIEADLVVMEHGHNDSTASDADFKVLYKETLTQIRAVYPGAPIVCVIPFNRQKASVIYEIVPEEQNCYLVDCEEVYPYRYYVDGPGHLTAAGGQAVGNYIAQQIRKMHLL